MLLFNETKYLYLLKLSLAHYVAFIYYIFVVNNYYKDYVQIENVLLLSFFHCEL